MDAFEALRRQQADLKAKVAEKKKQQQSPSSASTASGGIEKTGSAASLVSLMGDLDAMASPVQSRLVRNTSSVASELSTRRPKAPGVEVPLPSLEGFRSKARYRLVELPSLDAFKPRLH